ncbi:hypothetical protein JTE90_016586, partial [Oedothorax gibbosus]
MFCVYVAAAFPQHQEKVKEENPGSGWDPTGIRSIRNIKSMPFHSLLHTGSDEVEDHRTHERAPLHLVCSHNLWIPHSQERDRAVQFVECPPRSQLWDYPESFIPDRFITKGGKSVLRPAHFMSFSM